MLSNYKKELEKIQKEIADVTNLAIVIMDDKGNYITNKENYSDFCSLFRKDKLLSSYCERCDTKALKKAKGTQEPYIYRCHSGLIDIAVPLLYLGEYIGGIFIGQVLLKKDSLYKLENIVGENIGKEIDNEKISEAYSKLPEYSFEKINSIANMVYYTGRYIIENIKDDKWHNHEVKNNIKDITLSETPIEDAITYIKMNLDKNIRLEELAEICSMSVSHFSKVFKKESGTTFKEYLNRKKIERAKYLLEESKDSISNISYSLGFEDTSYFTKIFKKYTEVTPKKYRELLEKQKSDLII